MLSLVGIMKFKAPGRPKRKKNKSNATEEEVAAALAEQETPAVEQETPAVEQKSPAVEVSEGKQEEQEPSEQVETTEETVEEQETVTQTPDDTGLFIKVGRIIREISELDRLPP